MASWQGAGRRGVPQGLPAHRRGRPQASGTSVCLVSAPPCRLSDGYAVCEITRSCREVVKSKPLTSTFVRSDFEAGFRACTPSVPRGEVARLESWAKAHGAAR